MRCPHAALPPLRALGDLLAREPDDPEYAISAGEVHTLLRLALVRRDRHRGDAHAHEAALLHLRLTLAYRAGGGYVATDGGVRYYHPHTLGQMALALG